MAAPFDPRKHHRQSIRLKNYDYSASGAYFVTICVHERACALGDVIDGEVRLNEIGQTVQEIWDSLPGRYPSIELDASVIMPNHAHGVIVIENDSVGAIHESPLHDPGQRRKMLLPLAIGYFKMNSAKRANQIRSTPGTPFWQRNYYEHIIRNDRELNAIREYIIHNPLRWDADLDNPINAKVIGSIDNAAYRREAGV